MSRLPSFTFLISRSRDFELIWLLMFVGHAPKSPEPKQCCLSLVSKHLHVDKEVLEIISSGKDDDDQCADEEQFGSYWAEAPRKSVSAWKMKHFSSYKVLLAGWGTSMCRRLPYQGMQK